MDPADRERAHALLDLDRAVEARDLLARRAAADPHDGEALCLLAQACLALGDPAAAVRAAQAAGRAAPDGEWAHRLLALALARCRRPDEALHAAEAALAADPLNWRTHVVRAEVDLIAGTAAADTVAHAREAVRLAPHESTAFRALGNALLATGADRAAESALREALRLEPGDAAARNDLARVHVRRRRHLGRAAAGFAAAAALDPGDRVAAGNLVVTGARALRVIHVILLIVLWSAGRAAAEADAHKRGIAALAFAAAAAGLGIFGLLIWRGARPRTWQLLRIVLRRDVLLAAWFGCLVAAFLLLAAAPLLPVGLISGTVMLSFLAMLCGVGVTWARSRRLRRAGEHAR